MKQPLVLLHGWGVNSLIWKKLLPLLESEFETTVIDLPGYGDEVEYSESYALDAITDEVLSRAPDKATWVGWSLGGTIAMAAAIAQPERFLKLQLVSATPRFLTGPDWDLGVELQPYQSLANDFVEDYEKAVQKFLMLQVHTTDRNQFRESRAMVRELACSFNQHQPPTNRTLRAGLQILSDTDLRPRLSELKVETQVIAGRNDRVVPVKASEYLFSRLENGHSIHQFNTGHMPFLQAPSNYIEALTSLMNSEK